jgi:hypothetical protein
VVLASVAAAGVGAESGSNGATVTSVAAPPPPLVAAEDDATAVSGVRSCDTEAVRPLERVEAEAEPRALAVEALRLNQSVHIR